MDIEKIKEIIDAGIGGEWAEQEIIKVLAADENVIPFIMRILFYEREQKKELTQDLNSMLSIASTGLDNPKINKGNFMQRDIRSLYYKWRNVQKASINGFDYKDGDEVPEGYFTAFKGLIQNKF